MSWLATWDPAEREAWEGQVADARHLLECWVTLQMWLWQVWAPLSATTTRYGRPGKRCAVGSGR